MVTMNPNDKINKLSKYDNGIKKWRNNEIKISKKNPNKPNSPKFLLLELYKIFEKIIPYPSTDNKQNKV